VKIPMQKAYERHAEQRKGVVSVSCTGYADKPLGLFCMPVVGHVPIANSHLKQVQRVSVSL
jgi:hypothetical protein